VLAHKSRSTFEATKTCRRRSKCLRKINPRFELNIIKIKVKFHIHSLEKILLCLPRAQNTSMEIGILTVRLQEKYELAVTKARASIPFFSTSIHIILKPRINH
jgi:hypothetical protein